MSEKTCFFLNEDIPSCEPSKEYGDLICACITNYLKKIRPEPVEGVFHTQGDREEWRAYLECIDNHMYKAYAYDLFSRSPSSPISIEKLLELDGYKTVVSGEIFENPYGHISAHETSGFLFTFPTVNELNEDQLPLFDPDGECHNVNNYYGSNYAFVVNELEKRRVNGLPVLEKIQEEWEVSFTCKFERAFLKLPVDEQESIYNGFSIWRDTEYRIQEQGSGVRLEITPSKINVYALKVMKPKAVRVYFTRKDGKLYIASLGFKSSGSQSADIKTAEKILLNMI